MYMSIVLLNTTHTIWIFSPFICCWITNFTYPSKSKLFYNMEVLEKSGPIMNLTPDPVPPKLISTLLPGWSICVSLYNTSRYGSLRGEREWHLGVREREWIIPFPKFGNGKGIEKTHSLNSGTGREWKKLFPKFGNGKGMKKSIPEIREREGNEKNLFP